MEALYLLYLLVVVAVFVLPFAVEVDRRQRKGHRRPMLKAFVTGGVTWLAPVAVMVLYAVYGLFSDPGTEESPEIYYNEDVWFTGFTVFVLPVLSYLTARKLIR